MGMMTQKSRISMISVSGYVAFMVAMAGAACRLKVEGRKEREELCAL